MPRHRVAVRTDGVCRPQDTPGAFGLTPELSTATATSVCWRERPLPGNFRGDRQRQVLAVLRLMRSRIADVAGNVCI